MTLYFWVFDNWYDYVRLFNLVASLICVGFLVGGLKRQGKQWNAKTRDLWYSRIVFSLAVASASFDGIARDFPNTVTLGLLTAATLTSLNALRRKGSWGYDA